MKSLSGETLELGDGPAKLARLFLVDGNNLAYRGYYALPEEIATSYGLPTNALLGFASMLFKLITDYRPHGVAVCWDSRPVERLLAAPDYKAQRKAMPEKLREQFPHFRPLVTAFGYLNLEFTGWEADDVLATMASRADEARIPTCVVSTDRDALQLVSESVCLMMTPRGVSDPQVYTPERVMQRYGIGPSQITDFVALKGDNADNIPNVPGFGEKTAAELLARYGSLEGLLASVGDLPNGKRRSLEAHVEQARASKSLATLRRDLPFPCDPSDLVAAAPDRSTLRALFEKYEFKRMLDRVHLLEELERRPD